jgi:hypothetical protein
MMRLRIQTLSPLPELKAWFIPEIQDAQSTVFDLKDLFCMGIPQLRANQIHPDNLILLLEGFELLNESPISVVRDGDLIIVKMVQRMKEGVDMNPAKSTQCLDLISVADICYSSFSVAEAKENLR